MRRTNVLGLVLSLGLMTASFVAGGFARAQDSTEPPPPVAAPRGSVMAEELPRAGAIVVFGAAQPVGLEIVKSLAAAKKQVIAVLPQGADRGALDALKVEVLTADPLVPDQLKELFAAAPLRAVITSYDASGEVPAFGAGGTRNIIDATKATGVPRLVLVSATGAGDSAAVLPWYVRFLRGDVIAAAGPVEDHLKASGVDFTIVRTGWIIDEPAGGTAVLNEEAPVFSWIAPADLARLVASIIDTKTTSGKTATVVDPERVGLLSLIF